MVVFNEGGGTLPSVSVRKMNELDVLKGERKEISNQLGGGEFTNVDKGRDIRRVFSTGGTTYHNRQRMRRKFLTRDYWGGNRWG